MLSLGAVLAALLLSAPPGDAGGDRWILGPATVALGRRVTCVLPDGVALAHGRSARSILEAVGGEGDGSELAVLSPVAPARTWFAVVAWRGAGSVDAPPLAEGPVREGALVWLQRPTRDARTGRVTWAFAGPAGGGPVVNQHLRIPAGGGAVQVTLVAPVAELAVARRELERIVDGLEVGAPPSPERGTR